MREYLLVETEIGKLKMVLREITKILPEGAEVQPVTGPYDIIIVLPKISPPDIKAAVKKIPGVYRIVTCACC